MGTKGDRLGTVESRRTQERSTFGEQPKEGRLRDDLLNDESPIKRLREEGQIFFILIVHLITHNGYSPH